MNLKEVVPWGRNMAEYEAMFSLNIIDLGKRILGCGDGPASFNTEWSQRGGHVISVDPVYQFDRDSIAHQISQAATSVMQQVRQHQTDFIWKQIKNPNDLFTIRMTAMQRFLDDFDLGGQQGRFLAAALPHLPFFDHSFDLALCSHFLFLYSETISRQFHLDAVRELCRVADEVRIYPLVDLHNQRSPYLDDIIQSIDKSRHSVDVVSVSYQFQQGATDMLVIKRQQHHE